MENGMNNDFQNGNMNSTPENNVPVNDVPAANVAPVNDVASTNAPTNNVFSNTMNNVPANNMGGNGEKSKSNKKLVMICVIIALIVLLAVGGLFLYKSYVNNPLKLYKAALGKVYEEASEILDEIEEEYKNYSFEDSVIVDGSVKLDTNIPQLDDYTKYTYDFKMGLDLKNEKIELGASMNEGSKEIISVIAYILNNNIYLESDQAYNKMLYMESDEDIFADFDMSQLEKIPVSYDDIDTLMKKFTEYLGNALEEDKFEKKDGTVKLNGKEIKVTKVVYPLNENTLPGLINSVVKDLANDKEVIDILVKIAKLEDEDISASDIKEGLKSIKVSKDDFEGISTVDFCLYTKGFFSKVIGIGLEGSGDVVSYVTEGDISEFLVDAKEENLEFSIITNANVSNGKLIVEKKELLTFKMTVEEKDKSEKIELEFDLDIEGEKISGKLVSSAKEISDKKVESSFDVEFKMTAEGETIEASAELDLNTEIGGKVANVNTSGAVNMETLTETEMQTIMTNIENAVKDTFLYDLLLGSDDDYSTRVDDYDYDYNYDYDLN